MLKPKRKEFDEWYEQHKNDQFNLNEELEKYGSNDVILLTHALVRYRALVRKEAGNPYDCILSTCSTLASSTLRDLRMNHLDDETVAIVPSGGYGRHDIQSRIAIKFLEWWANENGKHVIHRDNEGEKR